MTPCGGTVAGHIHDPLLTAYHVHCITDTSDIAALTLDYDRHSTHNSANTVRHDIQITDPRVDVARIIVQELAELERWPSNGDSVGLARHRWLDMLAWSGGAPEPDDQARLFCVHTLLVILAQAIISCLASDEDLLFDIDLDWPKQCGERGLEAVERIASLASKHDWQCEELGVLHHALIPIGQRKSLGEYYTPQWLAEAMTINTLDDEWVDMAVTNALSGHPVPGVGMLDPACGSGIFVTHAIRRLRDSPALRGAGLSATAEADVLASLVTGMDIHPVSVELSRASVARALGTCPSGGTRALGVHWGDALQADPVIRLERAQIGEIQRPDALGLQARCASAAAYLRALLA